jgi:Co/Zn/Cd efflux system component
MDAMAIHDLSAFRHEHSFDPGNPAGERRTWIVVGITAVTMVAEIVAGLLTGSMALLADGWHMATHVVALSIAGFAYLLARRLSRDERFAFGTWKIEVLGAFTSALLLGVVAIAMVVESAQRFVRPEAIAFAPALVVAVVGLAVNIICALVLGQGHDRGQHQGTHDHDHGHDHHGTTTTTIITTRRPSRTSTCSRLRPRGHRRLHLGARDRGARRGPVGGWSWLDPAMGIVGRAVILWWSKGLSRIRRACCSTARWIARGGADPQRHPERRRRRDRRPARLARGPRQPRRGRHGGREGPARARGLSRARGRHRLARARLGRGEPLPAAGTCGRLTLGYPVLG